MAFAGTTHPSLTFAAGHADQLSTQLDLGVQAGLLEDLHAVVIAQRSQITFEKYFAGQDECWGQPLGNVQFGPDTLHDLRSVTKSITSLLYGIALAEGKVPAPDTPLLNAFPQYADLAEDPHRAAWTIANALNMNMGTEWNEQLPYSGSAQQRDHDGECRRSLSLHSGSPNHRRARPALALQWRLLCPHRLPHRSGHRQKH